MSDCPHCDWGYDETAACLWAVPTRTPKGPPIVWDGTLRVPRGSEEPNGRREAAGWHICTAHTYEPEVLLMGPWREYAPLEELNAALDDLGRIPLWKLAFMPRRTMREFVTAGEIAPPS